MVLSSINFTGHYFEDVIVSFFSMGNNAAGTVLDAVFQAEITVTVEQVERTPAKKTGLPFRKIVARIKTAVLMDEIPIVHSLTPPAGIFSFQVFRLGAQTYSPAFPSGYYS
jgi:hypothetical protein